MAKKSAMIGFKTTPEIKEKLEAIAEQEDRTVSYIINKILEMYLNSNIQNRNNRNIITTLNFDEALRKTIEEINNKDK